jgi:hypothetical protein
MKNPPSTLAATVPPDEKRYRGIISVLDVFLVDTIIKHVRTLLAPVSVLPLPVLVSLFV